MTCGVIEEKTLAALNEHLVEAKVGMQLVNCVPNEFEIHEVYSVLDPAAYVVRSLALFLRNQDPRRLKLCANEKCRWAFQDNSRNHSKRWCSSSACGNLTKVRAFRQWTKERSRR